MGNSACLSPTALSSEPLTTLALSHEEDDFVISLFQQRIPISEICKVTSLEHYKVLGSGAVPSMSAKPEVQELALLCLHGSPLKLHSKHTDVRAALMDDIKFLGGSDNTPEVEFNQSRVQIFCRIYDALLREEERERRRLASTDSLTPQRRSPNKDSLPPLTRVGLSFTLHLLVATIETVGVDRPQLLHRAIDIAAELIADLKPLSLVSAGEAVNRSVEGVIRLFEQVVSGVYAGVDAVRVRKTIAVLLGLTLAKADLCGVLELVQRVVTAQEGPEWTEAIGVLVKVAGNLMAIKPKGLPINWTWNTSHTGPNVMVTGAGLSITRANAPGWGCNLSEQTISVGVHYVEFYIERCDSIALLLGIAAKSYEALNRNCRGSDVICYQADGECYVHGSGEGNFGSYGAGDRVGCLVDMEEHTLIFFCNGRRVSKETIRGVPEEVALIVCFGGSDQLVTITTDPSVPQEYEAQALSVPLAPPTSDDSLFPTSVRVVLEDPTFSSFAEQNATGRETSLEAAAFVLTSLDAMGEGVFSEFRLDCIQPRFPKHVSLVQTYGLAIAVEERTFQALLSLLSFLRQLFRPESWSRYSFKTVVWASLSCLRLLRNHIFAAKILSLPDTQSGLIDSRKREIHEVLNFFGKVAPDTLGLELNAENQTAVETLNRTAALVTIHSFELFYPTVDSQLEFVIDGLRAEKQDEKRLVAEVLKKVSLPMSLLHAFSTADPTGLSRLQRFLETILEITTQQSLSLLQGSGKLDETLMTTLYVAQGVLLAQLAKSPDCCLTVFRAFFARYLANVHHLLQWCKEATGGKISNDFEAVIKKTILGAHIISLLRAMRLLQFDAEFSAKLILEMMSLSRKLTGFAGGRPEHVRGVATVKQTFESEHPYPNNADQTYNIEVPGAVYYILSFDPQCISERKYDYLELWTDEDHTSRLYRWEGDSWPSSAIVVKQRSLHFTFHSDQFNNFWGWKIDVAARVQVAMAKEPWVEELRNCCTALLVALCQGLIRVGEGTDRRVHSLLTNRLLRAGIKDSGVYRVTGEVPTVHPTLEDLVTNTRMEDRLPVPMTNTGLLQLTVKSLLPKRLVTRPAVIQYLPQLQTCHKSPLKYCDIEVLDELIAGSERTVAAFTELKRQAQVGDPHSSVSEMDQAERAVFAVVLAFFEQTAAFSALLDTQSEVSEIVKHMVKQCCKLRQWAQFHRQKLINESNAQVTYADLAKDIVQKCVLLLHTEYRQTLAEVGIEKVSRSLQRQKSVKSTSIKSPGARLRSGSKWVTVKKALATMRRLKTLQELRVVGSRSEPEDTHTDISEFSRVYDLIIDVLASPVSLLQLTEELKVRRNRAVARTVGLQILYMTSKAAPLLSKAETQVIISEAFSEAFAKEGRKQHFTEGTEGIDPFLNSCLRRSFFQLYQLLLERLQVNAVSELDCTSSSVFHYLMHTLNALSFPFEDQDAYSLLDLRIRESVNLLLNWSKGQRIFQHIPTVFDTSKTITDFKVHKEAEYRPSIRKEAFSLNPKNRLDGEVAEEVEGQTKLALEVIRGPYPIDLLPVTDVIVGPSSGSMEGYTKIPGNVNEIGEELSLFVKREKPKEGGQYLVKATVVGWNPVAFDFKFRPYEAFLVEYTSDDDKEQRRARKLLLKRGAWLLFKMLTYTAAGKSEDQHTLSKHNNRFKLQELFSELIFAELKWLPPQGETERSLSLRKLLSGKNWRNSEIPLIVLKTNPVVEWVEKIREDANEFLFRAAAAGEEVNPFEVSLMDNVNDYISSTDPCLQGVLEVDDLPEGLADIPEEYFNTKKQVDFFCFLRHIVSHIDTAVSPVWAKSVKSSPLYQNLPIDFYEATARGGEGSIASILNVFLSTIGSREGDSFRRYLEMFASAEVPGVIPANKIPEGTPNDFLNEEKQLDFFTTIKVIRENEVKFSGYFREIKPLMRSYSVLPPSCSGFYKVRLSSSQMEYQASLLLVLYQCCSFQGMLKVLSKSVHLLELLKHMLMGSLKSSTIAFRIVREILATQHSPESFAGTWSSLPKGKLRAEFGANAAKDFTLTLFTFIGAQALMHAKSWKHSYISLRKLMSLSQDSLDLLLVISRNEVWGRHIVGVALRLFAGGEWEALVGALVFLTNAKENVERGAREWSKVELRGAGVTQATLVKLEDSVDTVKLYCEADDAIHKERKECITHSVGEFSLPLLDKLPSDMVNTLFSSLISLFLRLSALKASDTSAEARVYTSATHRTAQCYVLDVLALVIDSKHELQASAVSPLVSALVQGMNSEARDFAPQTHAHIRSLLFTRHRSKMTTLLKSLVAESKHSFTEEEEAKTIGKYSDEQQFLVGMLKSMGFGFGDLKEAIDQGCSDAPAVLSRLAERAKRTEPVGKDDMPLLYRLARSDRNAAILRDSSGKVSARETPSGHLVIASREALTEPKLFLKRLEENMFCSEESPPEELTILATVGFVGQPEPAVFGLVVGEVRIRVEVNAENLRTARRNFCFRIFIKFTGKVEAFDESSGEKVVDTDNGFSFEDISETKFGVFLQSPGQVALKGFSIFLRHYTYSPSYWSEESPAEQTHRGALISFEPKAPNIIETALQSVLGVPKSVSTELYSVHSSLKSAITGFIDSGVDSVELGWNYGDFIQDCVILRRREDMPLDYVPVKVMHGVAECEVEYNGPILAIKTSRSRDRGFVRGIEWRNDALEVQREEKGTPLTSLLILRVSEPKQVSLPLGFSVLMSQGKAVNLTPSGPHTYFLIFSRYYSIRGFPFTDFTQMAKRLPDCGLVDSFDPISSQEPDQLSTSEAQSQLATLSVVQLQSRLASMERSYMATGAFQLVLRLVQRWSGVMREVAQVDRLLEHSGADFVELRPALEALLREQDSAQRVVQMLWIDVLTQLCKGATAGLQAETRVKTLFFESSHPYENNLDTKDEIRIPGATKLIFTFDPQCRSENNYDYLQVARDKDMEETVSRLTGNSWQNFELEGDTAYMLFHSDISNNEWGYKFTVSGVLPGDEATSCGVRRALWLLETQLLASSRILPNLCPLLTSALALFAHTTRDLDHSLRAFALLKSLLLQSPTISPIAQSTLQLIAKETAALYAIESNRQKKSELLITAIGLVTELKEKFEVEIEEEWFRGFYENYGFLRGLVEKNEEFQFRLLKHFLDDRGKSLDIIRESAHPYQSTLSSKEVYMPGASSIEVVLSPESEAHSGDALLFTTDLACEHPVLRSLTAAPLVQTVWASEMRGTDVLVTDSGKSVTRTSSSGWGCVVLDTVFSSGKVRIVLTVEAHDESSFLYLGVIQECGYSLNACANKDLEQPLWTYRANGEFHSKGFVEEIPSAKYSTGDEITISLDFDEHSATFFKNKVETYTFSDVVGPLAAIACFGGNNQRVALVAVEQFQPDPFRLSEYRIEIPGDRFYYHFPVNCGYLSLLSAAWKEEKHPALVFANSNQTVSRRPGPESAIIVYSNSVIRAGRHLFIVKFPVIGSAVSIGLYALGFSESVVEYWSSGAVKKRGESISLEGFRPGDTVALALSDNEVRAFKDGEQVSQVIRVARDAGKEYRWGVACTGEMQAELIKASPLLESLDLIGRTSPSVQTEKFGYRFTAAPVYKGKNKCFVFDTLGALDGDWQSYYKAQKGLFAADVCEQLVNYVDEVTSKSDKDPVLLQPWEIDPTPQELLHYSVLEKLSVEDLRLVFAVIRDVNVSAVSILPLVSLELNEGSQALSEIQQTFLTLRGSLFLRHKQTIFRDFLSKTHTFDRATLEINRTRASRQKERGMVDTQGVSSIFGQVYRKMNSAPNRSLRSEARIFQANFLGEGAIDAGGPYNEVMSSICEELQSRYLPLLVQCPNGVHNLGDNRDTWVPNPAADTALHADMLLFLGKLMGVAIRTKNNLNLSLAPLFWKRLIFEPVTLWDLKSFDECIYQTLDILRHLEEHGISSDNFEMAFGGEMFTTVDSASRTVELTPGGKDMFVLYRNAKEYADLLERQRLTESASAYAAIRKGLSAVVPLHLLYLFSWKQVETLVCGAPDINIDLLRSKTIYEGFESSSEVVSMFWEVMRELSPHDRTLFLRFVWGRSKLPAGTEFKQFTVTKKAVSGDPDEYLPLAHTCFFTLDLPVYTCKEVMRNKLVYAITHCQAIDLDRVAGAEGWDEDA